MRTLLLMASLALTGTAAPAAAKGSQVASRSSASTCDAKYYGYLVGKSLDAARDIDTSNYRVIPQGANTGPPQATRMTVVIDKSNQIVAVDCG